VESLDFYLCAESSNLQLHVLAKWFDPLNLSAFLRVNVSQDSITFVIERAKLHVNLSNGLSRDRS